MSWIERLKPALKKLPMLPTWVNGERIWLPAEVWGAFRLAYEPEVAVFLQEKLMDCSVLIDVGAHVGLWTTWACRRFPQLRVVAIEPGQSRQMLEIIAHKNGVRQRISTMSCCVSGSRGVCTYWDNGGMTSGVSREWAERFTPAAKVCDVETRTLDEIVEMGRELAVGRRVLVKCDVEGHEREIFERCEALGDSQIEFLVELHQISELRDSIVVKNAEAAGRSVRVIGSFWGGSVTVAF